MATVSIGQLALRWNEIDTDNSPLVLRVLSIVLASPADPPNDVVTLVSDAAAGDEHGDGAPVQIVTTRQDVVDHFYNASPDPAHPPGSIRYMNYGSAGVAALFLLKSFLMTLTVGDSNPLTGAEVEAEDTPVRVHHAEFCEVCDGIPKLLVGGKRVTLANPVYTENAATPPGATYASTPGL